MRANEMKRRSAVGHHDARRAIAHQRRETDPVEVNSDCLRQLVRSLWKLNASHPTVHGLLNGRRIICLAVTDHAEVAKRFRLSLCRDRKDEEVEEEAHEKN